MSIKVIKDKCTGCTLCVKACPFAAIEIKDKLAIIDLEKCTLCGACVPTCKFKAIEITWEEAIPITEEKMAEYASGIVKSIAYSSCINFAIHITKECDCLAKNDPNIVDDIGILASADPVALDKATLDLIIEKSLVS